MDPGSLFKGTSRSVSKLGSSLLPSTSAGMSALISKYITIAVIVFLFLSAAGPNAPGPLGVGLVQSIKKFLIDTLPFFIIAYGLLSRNKNGLALYTGGLFVVSALAFVILNNLPVGSGSPSWVINGKAGLVDLANKGSQGLVVATAAIVAL